MVGYATDETEEMMPLTLTLAHKMNELLAKHRRDGTLPWVRPDSKTQVVLRIYLHFQRETGLFCTVKFLC